MFPSRIQPDSRCLLPFTCQPLFSFFLLVTSFFVLGQVVNASVLTVPSGGDFQAALNAAQPGDTIVLQAGATYVGSFTLPVKSGTEYITVQTSALAGLPDGVRVGPLQVP